MIKNALWIAPAGAEKISPCHFLARKEIELSATTPSLTVQIACDSLYLLSINGIIAGRGPARCTDQAIFYDEYELGNYFHPGKNEIRVLVLCMNCDAEATRPITPALRLAVGDITVTDASWEMYLCDREFPANGPLFTRQSGYAEWRDLNFDSDLTLPEKSATVIVPTGSPLMQKKLLKRDVPMPLETPVIPADIAFSAFVPPCDLNSGEFAKINTAEPRTAVNAADEALLTGLLAGECAVTLPMPQDNGGISIVIDFAKEISGRIEITLDAPAGAVADLVYEEELYQGDRLRADHTHTNPSYQFCDRYILRNGRQQIGGLLVERGFRMVQLTLRNLSRPVTISCIRAVDVRYPFARRGQFFCSDYQLNRLWETAAETISACTTDVFTDCPWRERLFYCNDLLIENRTALKIFGDAAIHRRAFRMIFSQNRSDDLFTSVSPSNKTEAPDGKTDFNVILSGNLTLAIAMKEYFLHTGDIELVKECISKIEKMLRKFQSWKNDRGIICPPVKYWNFFDWSFELNGMDFSGKPSALLNFLYIISARAQAFLAQAAGTQEVESSESLELMLQNTIAEFYSQKDCMFLNSTVDTSADDELLIALGVPPDAQIAVSSRLVHAMALLAGSEIELCKKMYDETLLIPELYYGIFLLDGYEALRDSTKALQYIRKYWGEMLDSGTPTLWENGVHKKGKAGFGGSASLCHGFSSSPAAFLQSTILGIAPMAPGFSRFRFIPAVADLHFAKGSVPTPHGTIRAAWKRENGKISAELYIPGGCIAETPAGVFYSGKHEFCWEI